MPEFSGYPAAHECYKKKIRLVKLMKFSLLYVNSKVKIEFLLLKGIAQ